MMQTVEMVDEAVQEDERRYTYAEAAEWLNERRGSLKEVKPATVQMMASHAGMHPEHEIRYLPSGSGRLKHAMPRVVSLLRESQLEELLQARQPKPKAAPRQGASISPKRVEHDVQVLRDKYRDLATEVENLRERTRRLEHKWSEVGL